MTHPISLQIWYNLSYVLIYLKNIYTCWCSEVCNNALGFWRNVNQNLKEQWMFFSWSLQGVTPSSLISWEVASVQLYKTSSFKSIPSSKRSLSIFIWKGKDKRFHPEVLWKDWTSKNAVKLTICKTNESKIKWETNNNIM